MQPAPIEPWAPTMLFAIVFGSFIFESDRVIKFMGTGLATAILLDATIVRMLLVPATMELLGDRNWSLPRWLDRLLPDLDVEGRANADVLDPTPAFAAGVAADGRRARRACREATGQCEMTVARERRSQQG